MDAIRIARAHTGRDDVVKIAGAYHGHADTTMVSVGPEPGAWGAGIPESTVGQVRAVPFNDADAMATTLAEAPPPA